MNVSRRKFLKVATVGGVMLVAGVAGLSKLVAGNQMADFQAAGGKVEQIIAVDMSAPSVTGTTSDTVLKSVTIPKGTIGANGWLVCRFAVVNKTGLAAWTLKVKWGGTTIWSQNESTLNLLNTSISPVQGETHVFNRNTTSSQLTSHIEDPNAKDEIGSPQSTSNFSLNQNTTTIDTTADQTLQITVTPTNSSDVIVLRFFTLEAFQ